MMYGQGMQLHAHGLDRCFFRVEVTRQWWIWRSEMTTIKDKPAAKFRHARDAQTVLLCPFCRRLLSANRWMFSTRGDVRKEP